MTTDEEAQRQADWLEHANNGEGPAFDGYIERDDFDAITDAVTRRDRAQSDIDLAVCRAREKGASWRQIGDALGVSRQGAHERYAHV